MVLALIAIAVGDETAVAHPGDDATLGFTILTFGGPALFLPAQVVFLREALGHVPRSRPVGLAALTILAIATAPLTLSSGSRRRPPCSSPRPSPTRSARAIRCPVRRRSRRSSPRRHAPRAIQLVLQALEHAHHPQPAGAVRARDHAVAHAGDEVLALQAQRLGVVDARGVDVAGAGDVLAVALGGRVKALVVDRELALDLHVVEGRHPLGAHDREA